MTRRDDEKKLTTWQRSARFRQIGREAITRWNRIHRPKLPKCRATAKSTGEQCQQPAMKNGTCRFHGGRTGAGADWHLPRWPNRTAPDAEAKLQRKLKDLEKAAKKRERKIAAASPEERERHAAWQKSHKPGPAAQRAAARRERRQNADLVAQLHAISPPLTSPEAADLQSEIDRLEALLKQSSASAPHITEQSRNGASIFD